MARILAAIDAAHWSRVHGEEMSYDESERVRTWDVRDAWQTLTGRAWEESRLARMTPAEMSEEIRRMRSHRARRKERRASR